MRKSDSRILPLMLVTIIAVMVLPAVARGQMVLHSLSSTRGTPGSIFKINGVNFGVSQGTKIPSINRCRAFHLEVTAWTPTAVKVRIPSGLSPGKYKVLIYYNAGTPSGITSSNSLDFWVTAADVPATITDPYAVQVRSFKLRYGKSNDWENWMLLNRGRYATAFNLAQNIPCQARISFRYDTAPIPYNPPWASEAAHMAMFKQMADGVYVGYDLLFFFNGTPASAFYAHVIGGIPSSISSHASGNDVFLHYETIFNHEFGHVMGLLHHYDTLAEVGAHHHMPPGEPDGCIMDRNSSEFCSACRTALNIPLDAHNATSIDAAVSAILAKYPPGF